MDVNIQCAPAYAMAYCHLQADEEIRVASGSMVAMSDGLDAGADMGPGGLLKGLARKALGGQSLFMGTYRAQVHGAWVAVAPRYPGDIAVLDLGTAGPLMVTTGCLLASSDTVQIDVAGSDLPSFVSHEGATRLHVHGSGTVLVCSYGGLQRLDVQEGQTLTVDTGHLVAHSHTMHSSLRTPGSLTSSALSGEGLVMELSGPGMVLLQTRAEQQLRSWLLPNREQGSGH